MSLFSRMRSLWRGFTGRRRFEAEMDEEFRFHLERRTDDLIRSGLPPREAARRARIEFGSVEVHKERGRAARGLRLFDELGGDVRYAVRTFRGSPLAFLLAGATLAVAIAAATTTWSVVSGVLLRSLPLDEPERLVSVGAAPRSAGEHASAAEHGATLAAGAAAALLSPEVFQNAAVFRGAQPVLTGAGAPRRVVAWEAGPDFFEVLGTAPLAGRTLTGADVEDDAGVAVVSRHMAVTYLGGVAGALGRGITLHGRDYQVVGVMPADFPVFTDGDVWRPDSPSAPRFGRAHAEKPPGADAAGYWVQGGFWLVGRLRPGTAVPEARARLENAFAGVAPRWVPVVRRVRDLAFGTVRRPLLLLLGAVMAVLLLTCLNVAALLLARGVARRHEMAIRLSMGAGRGRLLRQHLTESLVLSVLSGVVGAALSVWAVPLVVARVAGDLPRADAIGVDWRVLGFALAAAVVTGLLAGFLPAVFATAEDPAVGLKEGGAPAGVGRRALHAGEGLLVLQVALGTVLLTAGTLLGLSFLRLTHVKLGFNPDRIVVAQLGLVRSRYGDPAQRTAFTSQLLDEARGIPGVEAAAIASGVPLKGGALGTVRVPGADAQEDNTVAWFTEVTPDFFRVFGIPLLRGRVFKDPEPAQAGAIVVNQAFARAFFPGQDPIGRRVDYFGGTEGQIVGVVADVRQSSLDEPPPPQLYYRGAAWGSGQVKIAVRTTGGELQAARALEGVIHGIDPLLAIDRVGPMDGLISDSVARPRLYALLLSVFASIALMIALLGLYGFTAWAVRCRTREIGVRMALGASALRIGGATLARTGLLALGGVALGLLASVSAARVLNALLFGLTATDPRVLVGVALILAGAAALAAVAPAWRAAGIDPMEVLRTE